MDIEELKLNMDISDEEMISNDLEYLKTLEPRHLIDDLQAYNVLFFLGAIIRDQKTHRLILNVLDRFENEPFGNILLALYHVSPEIDFNENATPKNNLSVRRSSLLIKEGTVLKTTNRTTRRASESFGHVQKHFILNKHADKFAQNRRRISLLGIVLQIVNELCQRSVEFSVRFASSNGLKAHLAFLQDKVILNKILHFKLKEFADLHFVDSLVLNLNTLSACFEKNRQLWLDANVVELLLDVVKLKPSTKLDAFLIICNVASDKQIETLTEIHELADYLTQMLDKCARNLLKQPPELIKRHLVQLLLDDDEKDEASKHLNVVVSVDGEFVYAKLEDQTEISIDEILRGLYKLSVNDTLRTSIFGSNELSANLKIILARGNRGEQMFALKLLCQLSFNREIAEAIERDKEFVEYLLRVNDGEEKADEVDDKRLGNLKKALLWNLKLMSNNVADSVVGSLGDEINGGEGERHVMISYNAASRDLCLKIKSELEAVGHKVMIKF